MSTVTPLGRGIENSVKVRADPIPGVNAAGHGDTGIRMKENADYSIRQDVHLPPDEPSTPEHLKKFRKTNMNEPGKIQKHYGMANDAPRFPEGYSYGKSTYASEHVSDVIQAQALSGLADKFNDIKEAKYASHVKEPLGMPFSRDYKWPEKCQAGAIAFGKESESLEAAKEMIAPRGGAQHDPASDALYRKTHMNYAPGEQKHRDYEWKFNPNDHVFGYAEKKVANGAAMALHAERPEEMYPKTVIVKKTVEDHKAVAGDLLGKTKNLGQGQVDRGADFVHGIKNLTSTDIWNAGHCIHGEPGQRELQPDLDLGRSSKPGTRNVVRHEKDQDRSFGLPTIRNDIPYKAFRSVANYQNFGDEPEAVDLLFPSNFNEVGVNEKEFQKPRTRDQIKMIFENIGFKYQLGKFNAIYNRAKEVGGSTDDQVCVRDFQYALSEMHQIE